MKTKDKKISKKLVVILLIVTIIAQTLIYVKSTINKSYIHMDEAYSLGLASYDKVEIQDNEDFYNTWHDGAYYEDYLAVNDDEKNQFSQVYENQKNDVHPPFYYLLLRIAMSFTPNHFSKWSGIILNMIIAVFITIFVYLILSKLLEGKDNYQIKALVLTFISAITLASITNVIYIRMYALSTLNVLIITYLHMLLLDKHCKKILALIGISALIGSLTHYYFLFYLFALFVMTLIRYIRSKDKGKIISYIATMCIAGGASLLIFPYSIKHMFFGYRGDGVISNLLNVPKWTQSLGYYLGILHLYAFNCILAILVGALIILLIIKLIKKDKKKLEINKYYKYIIIPTFVYFFIAAVASPWIELRYVLPICTLLFISLLYIMNQLLEVIINKKVATIVISIILVATIAVPFIIKIEPQETYSDRKEIVNKLENELNLPTVYWFNSNENRFLDDILLFSKLRQSYIAKDYQVTKENMIKIFSEKDTSKGIILIINEGQQNDEIIDRIISLTDFSRVTWLKRMNACDIYYME